MLDKNVLHVPFIMPIRYVCQFSLYFIWSFFLSYEINLLSRLVKNKDHKQRFRVRYDWWSLNNVMWSPVHETWLFDFYCNPPNDGIKKIHW